MKGPLTRMDTRTQAVLLLALAAVAIRFGLSDAALAYIKPGLQPVLLASGVVLVLLGGHGLLRAAARTPAGTDGEAEHGHDHADGPGVAWLLAVPLLVLLLIAPPALGSFAVGRQGTPAAVSDAGFVELPVAREGAIDLGMYDFVARALQDPDRSLHGVPVRLVGFVVPDGADGYLLSRFTMNCCAADATAYSTRVVGDGVREADTWVQIVGRWEPGNDDVPVLVADEVTEIPAPADPYEY